MDPSAASATTPADKGKSKPTGFIIWLPWRSSSGISIGSSGSYGEFNHQYSNQEYYALDFMLPMGENVYPIATGDVIYAGPTFEGSCSYGNVVMIDHVVGNEHYQSLYAHLSEVSAVNDQHISIGSNIPIGKVGNSSCNSNNPVHLHFALFQGASFANGRINKTNAISIVPEPFVGAEVYEGFGLKYPKWRGPLIASYPGPSADLSAVRWSSSAAQDGSTISKGQTLSLSVDGLPPNVKEVRLTAFYPNWSNGLPSGWPEKVWRILARCWPNVGKSNCSWNWPDNTRLTYQWDPYSDGLQFDGDWWGSGSNYVNPAPGSSQTEVCISFDVFDKAGNVVYAPSGVRCGTQGSSASVLAANTSVSSQAVSSARLIYIEPSSSTGEKNPPSGAWISPANGQTLTSRTVTLSVNAWDNAGGSGVREVRWAAKYNGEWQGIGTVYNSPYSISWDWCRAGVQNQSDIEFGFEVWDHANNQWIYGNFYPNIHVTTNFDCGTVETGSIHWSTHFYSGMDHWWNETYTGGEMCSGFFDQGNLYQNYYNNSPCNGNSTTDNWIGDYKATVNFLPGNYAFWVDHDDWLKLKVDGHEIYSVNGVHSEWKCVDNGYLYLSGNHDIWVILAEQGGDARVKVEWSKNNGVCDLPGSYGKSSPLNGSDEQSLTPTLSWSETSGAKSYTYCIDTTNNNSCENGGLNVGSATSVTLNNLQPDTTYYWQVTAYSQGGAGTEADRGTWWSFTTQPSQPRPNLLMNNSFEEGTDAPTWWENSAWRMTNSAFEWGQVFAHSGIRSISISNNPANDAHWTQTVSVQPNSSYRLSGWIMTDNVSHSSEWEDVGANLSILDGSHRFTSPKLFGDHPWTRVSLDFDTGSSTQITIAARLGMYSGTTTGFAWFDDLKLELLSAPTCYTLTSAPNSVNGGSLLALPYPNCNNGTQYVHGTVVTLTAIPNTNSTFVSWSGDETGSKNPIYVTMTVDKSVTANFRSNGADTTGVFRPTNGFLFLKNHNTTGFADMALNYGLGGDYPVVGDWDGNGTVTIGIYRNGKFYLRNSNSLGFADLLFAFGVPGDQPIAGDWNGDGVDTIGVYRSSTGQFLLRNSNTAGPAEMSFYLGNVGDVGIAGDWDGDGMDTTGVFRPSNGFLFLKNINSTGYADIALNYGLPGDKPVTGDWDGDGDATIGVYRGNTFYLRNENTNGFADIVFSLGNHGDHPIAGNWDGIP